jgi:hypothetical protein
LTIIQASVTAAPFTAAEIFVTVMVLLGAALAVLVTFAQINATAAKRRTEGCKGSRCADEGVRVKESAYGLEYSRFWCADHDVWSVEL